MPALNDLAASVCSGTVCCRTKGHTTRTWLAGAVAVLLAMGVHDLSAQAVLKGRIRAAQSETPLALVEVLIENLQKRVWTNDSGDFRITGIPIGSHQLRVRRVGFEGAVATLTVKSTDSLDIDLALNAWVPELEPIYVRAPRRSRRAAEIEAKQRSGFGRFLAPDDLRNNEHRQLFDLVRQLGIEVLTSPSGNNAYAIGNRTPTFANPSTRCRMSLWINDVRVEDPDLTRYRVSELEAVEIYRRASETPVRYSVTATESMTPPISPDAAPTPGGEGVCGVIVLWTRE
ncbi:MAG: carboxypeptidase regulatory-like domain-containing protein [Gemmatimonadales bacterium]|nr:carboxypeptidase regulatory-like domain-containing protein [Gemmatimonadales bacterium]